MQTMTDISQQMQDLLDQMVAQGRERGLQLAVYHKGQLIIDICSGTADASGRPMQLDTLVPIFSVGKGLVATIIHLLVERGKLTYDMPIAKVWPEFAQNGKQGILLRHALSHTAGLQLMPPGLKLEDILDWQKMCAGLAGATPASVPGAQQVYHAVTFGWLLGEVARRVDGRPFTELLRDEICRPLGITDLFTGLADSEQSRVAILEEQFAPGATPTVPNVGFPADVAAAMMPLYAWMNMPQVRSACIPASNGVASARALARLYAALLPGGVDGVELLPPTRIRKATVRQMPNTAQDNPPRMSLGYFLGGPADIMSSRISAFGHGGYGGSIGFADPRHQLAVGLTKNLFCPQGAQNQIIHDLRKALGIPQ
jgi:CubicO group peptidase (beta-lactamase class C family)